MRHLLTRDSSQCGPGGNGGHATSPQFDPTREEHFKLAELGRACTQKVADWLEADGPGKVRSIGKLRSMVREMLGEELGEIGEWV